MIELLDRRFSTLIFENVPHGIFTVDEDRRITSFNRTAEKITGWRRAEVVGRPCSEVFRSDHCQQKCFLFHSIQDREQHRDQEVLIHRKDGSTIPVAVSTAALDNGSGEIAGGVEMFRDLSDVNALRRKLKGTYTCQDIVTKSPAMQGVRDLLPLVARSSSTVLIEGEPGTGKELVARAIHNLGRGARRPFVAVNCGAIPDPLVESELFGYKKGAFTDAKRDKPGRFEAAKGGTLFLDEVAELSSAMQVKLLRVLQEREYTPLGAVDPVTADVRVLAATNRNLAAEVAAGRFRQDLYFRLNVVKVGLPPLRSRREDIPLLVEHFISRFNLLQGRRIQGISERAMARLLAYPFPGNVRELENAVEHAFVVCGGATVELEDLPQHIMNQLGPTLSPMAQTPLTEEEAGDRSQILTPLESAEAQAIGEALDRNRGNRTSTARELGVSRNTLWRKMRRYGIE